MRGQVRFRWRRGLAPALLLAAACAGRLAIQPYGTRPLEVSLASFPTLVATFEMSRELDVPERQRQRLQADELLHREYRHASGQALTVYVAYYGRQGGGHSIHSPDNCLPGSGWESVESDRVTMQTAYGRTEVNRVLIEHGSGARALVYYWYQGRGRVVASEYRVKVDLLRDAIFERRTDEGLVRLVFPLGSRQDLEPVDALAAQAVPEVIGALAAHLPG